MLKLIIGNKTYSSWSLRGWLAVKQSGMLFEEVVVPLYDAAWEARKREPDLAPSGGKVPTLWDDEAVVWESLAIIDYLDEISGGDKFWPRDKAARAMARAMAAEMHAGYMALRREHCMNLRHSFPPREPSAEVAADIERITDLWAQAQARFGGTGDYLFGDFGAADIMFAPVVTRFLTYSLPVPPSADAYMDAIADHPFLCEWFTEAAREPWVIDRFERPDLLG